MITGVHRSDIGEQRLRGADVAGRLIAANMLLPGLQRQPQCRSSAGIFRHSDDAAWHMALKSVPGRKKRRMGSTVAERDTKTLSAPNGDIRPEFSRRTQQSEG